MAAWNFKQFQLTEAGRKLKQYSENLFRDEENTQFYNLDRRDFSRLPSELQKSYWVSAMGYSYFNRIFYQRICPW